MIIKTSFPETYRCVHFITLLYMLTYSLFLPLVVKNNTVHYFLFLFVKFLQILSLFSIHHRDMKSSLYILKDSQILCRNFRGFCLCIEFLTSLFLLQYVLLLFVCSVLITFKCFYMCSTRLWTRRFAIYVLILSRLIVRVLLGFFLATVTDSESQLVLIDIRLPGWIIVCWFESVKCIPVKATVTFYILHNKESKCNILVSSA